MTQQPRYGRLLHSSENVREIIGEQDEVEHDDFVAVLRAAVHTVRQLNDEPQSGECE